MDIEIVDWTGNPMLVISESAGCCYSKHDASVRRVEACFERGHLSVFEHAKVTFRVSGISRACLAQLTRHRLASYCVQSQRFCAVDVDGEDWYVTPTDLEDEAEFRAAMARAGKAYLYLLSEGFKKEDVRYVLPEATKTEAVVTMNARELLHFLDLRTDRAAQWEIRAMAEKLADAVAEINQEWGEIIAMWRNK